MKKEIMNYETLLKITHGIVVSKELEEVAILVVESVKKSRLTYPRGFDWQR